MDKALYIESFVRINNHALFYDNKKIALNNFETLEEKLKFLYKNQNIQYPKFYKMDVLSKAGFIAVEYLQAKLEASSNTSLLFANQTASLQTDILYQEGINNRNNYVPSPSLFVYTLPNIVMGEICIKHKLTGENIFLVFEDFNTKLIIENIILQFKLNKADKLVFCWLEVFDNKLDVLNCIISTQKTEKTPLLNHENLNTIYHYGRNN